MVLKQVLKRYDGLNNEVDSDFDKVHEKQMKWQQLYETSNTFMIKNFITHGMFNLLSLYSLLINLVLFI